MVSNGMLQIAFERSLRLVLAQSSSELGSGFAWVGGSSVGKYGASWGHWQRARQIQRGSALASPNVAGVMFPQTRFQSSGVKCPIACWDNGAQSSNGLCA